MRYGEIFTVLKSTVASVVGVPPSLSDPDTEPPVDGEEQAWSYADTETGARVDLAFVSVASIGEDEVRREYDEDSDLFHVLLCGQRHIVARVTVTCEDQSDNAQAWPLAENIRARMNGDALRDALFDVEAGIVGVSDLRATPVMQDDWIASGVAFDFEINTVVNYEDPSNYTIDTVEITPSISGLQADPE